MRATIKTVFSIVGFKTTLSFGKGSVLCGMLLLLLGLFASPSPCRAGFDEFENWGFGQGGGFRQGNFTGGDTQLTVVKAAWDGPSNLLAVGGA
jgi:hypothetical protein